MAGPAKYVATSIALKSGTIKVYASGKVRAALGEVSEDMDLYKGVRLLEVLDAVYSQGRKDGAKTAIDKIEESVAAAKELIPHRKPGRPKKQKRK